VCLISGLYRLPHASLFHADVCAHVQKIHSSQVGWGPRSSVSARSRLFRIVPRVTNHAIRMLNKRGSRSSLCRPLLPAPVPVARLLTS
jgi:hypothetical protein